MKKIFLQFLILFSITNFLYANGGIPFNFIDAGSSRIILVNDNELNLKRENLEIKLEDDFAIVTCDYEIQNITNNRKVIDFAFNIPVMVGEWFSEANCLMYYKIFENDKEIEYDSKREIISEIPFENTYVVWKISKIIFSSNELKRIRILYKLKTNTNGEVCISEYQNNVFKYNLFPATSFGNGVIEEFTLIIDKTGLFCEEGRIENIIGMDIENDNQILKQKYSFKNFDLVKNPELIIEYNVHGFYIGQYIKDFWINGRFSKVNASSELTEGNIVYTAHNLNDGDYITPWVEGIDGFGRNEKVHFELFSSYGGGFRSQEGITHIYLVNGFRKNESTYYENNRLKKIRLWVNGMTLCILELPDRPFTRINDYNIAYEADLISSGITGSVNDFDIEILEVYPGTKFNDTCISEIIVLNVEIPTI